MRPDTTEFAALFLQDLPLLDTRAPVEFAKGAFPHTVNLPLMTDIERQKVGTCYKRDGQQAAIALGHSLVSGKTRQARIDAWVAHAHANPQGYLYCFRGGLRSQIVQQWLRDAGVDYPRITGGYKALRTFLLETLDRAVAECHWQVLGGMTGCGKTEVLLALPELAVDLEQHANHRGSSFGKRASGQPAQIDFENRIAIDLLKRRHQGQSLFVVEDEARLIGRCSLPLPLFQRMQQSPLIWLEDSFEQRTQRILKDYVVDLAQEFRQTHGEGAGFGLFAEQLQRSLAGIATRLGGERYQRLAEIMRQALVDQENHGRVEGHLGWISALLSEYYDPMYSYQRASKAERVVFAGSRDAVIEYLRQPR